MANYAIIKNNIVENCIVVADDDERSIQALPIFFPEADAIVLETTETNPVFIGGDFTNGKFRPPAPGSTWEYLADKNVWVPPVPFPDDTTRIWDWDEDSQQWTDKGSSSPKA